MLKDLEKKIGRKHILKSINLTLSPGIYGLLGPNGAGKTTLIRCLSGSCPISHGNIIFEGNDIKNQFLNIGYLPQEFGLFKELTVYESLCLFANFKETPQNILKSEVERCIKLVGLEEKANCRVKHLSGGMVRRVGIAQALLGTPWLILLDEPCAGLDPEERLRFKTIISKIKGNHIIIISTHIVEDVENMCDKLIVMNDGRIIKCDYCKEIQNSANGKVYEIQEYAADQIQKPFLIQRSFKFDETNYIRFLSSKKQKNAIPVSPRLEDGYMCTIKEI